MVIDISSKCELLTQNRDIIRSSLKSGQSILSLAGGSYFTALNIQADSEKLKECEKLLKVYRKTLSGMRGPVQLPVICKMALSEDPEHYLFDIQKAFSLLSQKQNLRSRFLMIAALIMCDHADADSYQEYADRTAEIFSIMKRHHRVMTGEKDVPFAAILAVSGKDVDVLNEEMERCYEICKAVNFDIKTSYSLSKILALSTAPAEMKCLRICEIRQKLSIRKHPFTSCNEISALGSISALPLSTDQIVNEIIAADDFLKQKKGYGRLTLGSDNRRIFAALIVLNCHSASEDFAKDAFLRSSLEILTQMDMCLITMGSGGSSRNIQNNNRYSNRLPHKI